jgi:uncharacterized protein
VPKPAADADPWQAFRIARIVDESSVIRSLTLAPVDGRAVAHQAGQYLPIRITPPGAQEPARRNYTLSVAPSDAGYRISVKRDGLVSSHLHTLREGDVIEARAPAGGFTIDAAERRPAVLLAAGIGVTPMLAMLRHLVHEGRQAGHIRPAWFFHSARSVSERAFDAELSALVEAGQSAIRLIRLLSDAKAAAPGDYDRIGRINMATLTASLPFNDYDFYLCGPASFMQEMYDGLRGFNIADARIHAEAFGPAALQRRPDHGEAALPAASPATRPVTVAFARAGREAVWTPGSGTLLDFAEANGLSPEFSCRNGSCGTCRTRIIAGEVGYATPPAAQIGADECLICCAMPARTDDPENRLRLDL